MNVEHVIIGLTNQLSSFYSSELVFGMILLCLLFSIGRGSMACEVEVGAL